MTVAHHIDDDALDRAFEELAEFDCEFAVGAFCLYVHESEAGWRPTRAFELSS